MNRFAAAALMWGAATLGACSSEHLGVSKDANVDTSTPVDSLGADRCTGSLDDLGGRCPASFDGSPTGLPACAGLSQAVKLCGNVIGLVLDGGFTALTCYYDATSHLLVGALEVSDTTEFCGGTSFGRFDGQVSATTCDTTMASFGRSCATDGGAG